MSDAALLDYITNKGFGCGRFREDQLGRELIAPVPPKRKWWVHVAFSVASFFVTQKEGLGQGNQKADTIQVSPTDAPSTPYAQPFDIPIPENVFTISGTLTDHKGEPLIMGKVEAKFQGISKAIAITNFDGQYFLGPFEDEYSGNEFTVTFTWQNFQQTLTNVRLFHYNTVVNNKLNTMQDYSKGMDIVIGRMRRYTRWEKFKMKVRHMF